MSAASEHFGTVDVLVNAAGIIATGAAEQTSDDDWEEVDDQHSYAIRQSDGALDLFDNQGYIRTAQSIR